MKDEQETLKFSLSILVETHIEMMNYIKDQKNVFKEMDDLQNHPLKNQHYSFGQPEIFNEIYDAVYEKMMDADEDQIEIINKSGI